MKLFLVAALCAGAASLNLGARPSLKTMQDTAVRGAMASSLAFAMAAANPVMTPAAAPTMAVERVSVALAGEEEQAKFMADRAKMKTQYETEVEGTYMTAEETKEKKATYLTVVYGLVALAFIAPMVQFFYYTGGK